MDIIVQPLDISRLDNCNSLLCGLPAILIKSLQRVQNAAARVIAKAGRRDHITNSPQTSLATGRIPHKAQDPAIDISCYTWRLASPQLTSHTLIHHLEHRHHIIYAP